MLFTLRLIPAAAAVQVFYTTTARASEVKGHWCHACYSEARDGLTQMDGSTVRKADLNKRKNDEEVGIRALES